MSIGVAEWSKGKTIDELLDDADREMNAAKADHRLNKGKPNLAKAAEQTVGFEQCRVPSSSLRQLRKLLDNVECSRTAGRSPVFSIVDNCRYFLLLT